MLKKLLNDKKVDKYTVPNTYQLQYFGICLQNPLCRISMHPDKSTHCHSQKVNDGMTTIIGTSYHLARVYMSVISSEMKLKVKTITKHHMYRLDYKTL